MSDRLVLYTKLGQLGIATGEETIESIISALPDKSSIWLQVNTVTDGYNPDIYPFKYGMLMIDRMSAHRVYVSYIATPGYGNWEGDYWSGAFSGWHRKATAEPPQEFDLPLAEGFAASPACKYFKTQDGVVTVIGAVSGILAANVSTHIANLPSGYHPALELRAPATSFSGDGGWLFLYKEGKIFAKFTNASNVAYFSFSFVADN